MECSTVAYSVQKKKIACKCGLYYSNHVNKDNVSLLIIIRMNFLSHKEDDQRIFVLDTLFMRQSKALNMHSVDK